MGPGHSISTQVVPKHWDHHMGNWNVTSLNGKKHELIWETQQHDLDIIGVSFSKCHGSDTVELNEGWKFFYSGVDVNMSGQAGVGIFVSRRSAHCVTDWIPLKGRVSLSLGYRNDYCAFCTANKHQLLPLLRILMVCF